MVAGPKRRFVVSDLGFIYAVHDTQAHQEYAFQSGKGKKHSSTNALNSRRVELFPTRVEAVRCALDLNARHERGRWPG